MLPKSADEFLKKLREIRDVVSFTDGEIVTLRNEEGHLHSETMPAYRSRTQVTWYRDGVKHGMDVDYWKSINYYWRGIHIPEWMFMEREDLDLDRVLLHENTEVRCVGLEMYGYERLENENKLNVIDIGKDEMILYSYETQHLPMKIFIIRLKNSTAEPDGSYKFYYLTVPPDMKTCKEAVAWTFNRQPSEYDPVLET